MSFWILGRDCKLGDRSDKQLDHVTPFKCQPINVKKRNLVITHEVYAYDLSDQALLHFTKVGPYLVDSCLLEQDHRIVFDQNQYYHVNIYVWTKYEKCESCDRYLDNCPSYVNQIEYGIEMRVVVLKDQLPPNKTSLEKLVKSVLEGDSELTVGQKQIDCHVLINHKETKEITLGELVDFIKAFERGQHQEYMCPVYAGCKTIKEIPALTIINWDNFRDFLTYLYSCYRKIEIKLEQAGYPGTFAQNKRDQSIDDIESALKTAKEEFKKMDRNNMFEMYFVLKRLWIAYFDYLKYSVDNRRDIDEGDRLPGTDTELEPFLRKLNTWTPVKKENKWVDPESTDETLSQPEQPPARRWFNIFSTTPSLETPKPRHEPEPDTWTLTKLGKDSFDCSKSTLIVPDSCKKVGQKMRQTTKLKNVEILRGKTAKEPHLLHTLEVAGLFGFVNMSGASGEFDPAGLEQLNTACPRHCTADIRTWICTACGGVVRVKIVDQLALVCACGSKAYKEDLLTCVNPEHEEQLKIDQFPDDVKRLTNQLKKHQTRYTDETNKEIASAVQQMVGRVSHLIESDGDTAHLINTFLEKEDSETSS